MGWETRSGKRYYYRKYRFGRQVISSYIGPGELGEEAELLDQIERERFKDEKELKDQQKRVLCELRKADQQALQAENMIRLIVKAAFLSTGYHTHHRQWRKKRCQNP